MHFFLICAFDLSIFFRHFASQQLRAERTVVSLASSVNVFRALNPFMEAGELLTHQAWISNPTVSLASVVGSSQLGLQLPSFKKAFLQPTSPPRPCPSQQPEIQPNKASRRLFGWQTMKNELILLPTREEVLPRGKGKMPCKGREKTKSDSGKTGLMNWLESDQRLMSLLVLCNQFTADRL